MNKNILIVGGSSGLGLDLAEHYIWEDHNVCVTGRHDPILAGGHTVNLTSTITAGIWLLILTRF
ncbi:MAG: short-subunit dehydrogenase involved in D-alanine esterification of teichoic acids [Granulosicoccus sp.]|jgi:short-subunit dehydrogenase involved in D-alanine esterification of teichoic acids